MGKPLSRPDCLRQSPACLGKGEDEDGYIEDCYVPQRSIYDTMRINEQIDQGSKPGQPSKSTLEKGDSSTISSNGTVGAPAAFESKAPESKKLDERVIFDALKLSSDVSKSAPAPARRRPNPEKKENVNRRSWKSFMPPNFPEFAERIEASLSEVSEAGASNPSLQEKQGSATIPVESSRPPDHGESTSEPLTLEHAPKATGTTQVQEPKPLAEAFGENFFQDECQPLLEPEGMGVDLTGSKRRDHQLSSATWPRAVKNTIKAGLSARRHDTLEADDSDCVIEMVPLSPCLSEELLDPGLTVLVTPGLREKTESELRFEEDERLIMMEADEDQDLVLESRKAAEKKNSGLMDISEEKEPLSVLSIVGQEAVEGSPDVQETSSLSSRWQELWDDSLLQTVSSAPVPQETQKDLNAAASAALIEEEEEEDDSACNAEALTAQLEEEEFAPGSGTSASPLVAEQFSDTDSVQMFLELEKLCMNEEERDEAAPVDLEVQDFSLCLEKLDAQKDSELLSENLAEASQQLAHLEVSAADSAVVSDLEDFDATYGSQVASTTEATVSEAYSERDTSGDSENVIFSSPPVAKDTVSQQSLSSLVSQMEEYGAELLTAPELPQNYPVEGLLDFALEEAGASVGVPCCRGTLSYAHVSTGGDEEGTEEEAVTGCEEEETSPDHNELATTPEELDSLAKEIMSLEGEELPVCFEMDPSERTDFSNWDVPELVSEDEVVELDKESFLYKGHFNETGSTDSSCVPSQSAIVLEEDSEELVTHPDSTGDLKAKEASSSHQLEPLPWKVYKGEVAMGIVGFQEEAPEVAAQITSLEGDILEDGGLEWLWGLGENNEASGGGEIGCEFMGANSSSLGLVECFSAAQPGVEDLSSTVGEEAGIVSSLASKEVPGSHPESTDELTGAAVGPSTIAAPVVTEEVILSPLKVLDASTLVVEGSEVEVTAFSRNEEGDGQDGLPAATWRHSAPESVPAQPSLEEVSLASIPFCMGNWPAQPPSIEELPAPDEQAKTTTPSSSEELIQVTQEGEEGLATLLPLKPESVGASIIPPELEDGGGCLLSLTPGALQETGRSTPQLLASTAPEHPTMVPDIEGPSASSLTIAAEGPPAGTDGLVPDNEVFVSLVPPMLLCRTLNRFLGTWEEVRS